MKRSDLISAMMKSAGGSGFISRKQLAKFMSLKDAKSVDRYLTGLQCLNQRYFVNDVADKMLEQVSYK